MENRRTIPTQCTEKKELSEKKPPVSDALLESVQSKVGVMLKREGLNREELSRRMNVSVSRLSQILNSKTLGLSKLEEIARALGYEVEVSFIKTADKI